MRVSLGVVLAGLLAVLSYPPTDAVGARPEVGPPRSDSSWVARVLRPVSVRSAPRARARAVTTVRPLAPLGRRQQHLAVSRSARGGAWIEVRLPRRPNGSRGWIPADAVSLHRTTARVEIDLAARRLSLFRRGKRILRVPIAVGAAGTPTPTGRFAIAERIRTGHPSGFLGPIVFPITGFSRTLNEYAGGDGRVAIHGTSLPGLIGTRASHGCIRLRNADIVRIGRVLRPGDPVLIHQ